MSLEPVVRPFSEPGHDPIKFTKFGQKGTPPVKIQCGMKGGGKTFTYSGSATTTSYMIRVHRERPNTALDQVS
jgi:hypothetical protein